MTRQRIKMKSMLCSAGQISLVWLLLVGCFTSVCTARIAQTDPKASASRSKSSLELTQKGAKLAAQALELEAQYQNATHLWLEAAELGNETAQYAVGVMYAWGLNGLPRDETKAVLNYYFSALGGSVPAMMALGYRHLRGDGVPPNCKTSAVYLELAANTLIDTLVAAGGVEPHFVAERIQAPDEPKVESKPYGDVEVVDYYHNLASKGDSQATGTLGRIYYYGARGVERDLAKAHQLLAIAAAKGDLSSMTSLGHILLKGVPGAVEPDPYNAYTNFTAAAAAGHAAANNGLGYMYLIGYPGVVAQDLNEALKSFSKAADGGVAEAFYNLGALYASSFKQSARDFAKAFRYFGLAAQKGSVLALHKVAHMTLHGVGTMRSCKTATQYLKTVSERAFFATSMHATFGEAYASFKVAPLEHTLERYLRLGEMGYEAAETNAARVLEEIASRTYTDEQRQSFVGSLHLVLDAVGLSHPPLNGTQDALRLYERAAEQGNQRARVKVGDYFFHGHADLGEPDMLEAAAHYRLASEGRDAQANFNLGYQHHYGLGLAKDAHLAKRYYDLARDNSVEARFPVAIASTLLWFETAQKAFWAGEKILAEDPALASWVEWWQRPSVFSRMMGYFSWAEYDSWLIGALLGAFVAVGYYRELRQQRRLQRLNLRRPQETGGAGERG